MQIHSFYKSPYAVVRVNGRILADILSIDVNKSLENSISTAKIVTVSRPAAEPEAKVVIELGYNAQSHTVFTGYIDTIEYQEDEDVYTLHCRDVLKRAVDTFLIQEVAFGIDVQESRYYYSTYSHLGGGTFTQHVYSSLSELNVAHPETTGNYSNEGVYAEAVVQWLLAMCGFAEGSEIQVRPTNFWIGDITPAKFHLVSVYDAILQIAELIGWRIFADRGGVVRFQERPRNPSAYPMWEYSIGARNIHKLNRSVTNTDVRNYVEVRGYNGIRAVARAPSSYIGNVPYRGVLIANDLIDTQSIANFMAARILNDLNRLKEVIDLEIDGNPYLEPGETIQLRSDSSDDSYLINTVNHTMTAEGYFTRLQVIQFPGDITYQEPPADISAVFRVVNLAVYGDPKYVAELDASASYSNRGQINRFIWQVGNDPPYEQSEPKTWVVFDEAQITNNNFVTVQLQVYDTANNTATYASGVTKKGLEDSFGRPAKTRALYLAATNTAQGSLNGGKTWNSVSIPAISCAASNFGPNRQTMTSGYALFGCSDNTIRRTVDGCVTVSTVLNDAGSPVNFVSIMELDSRYAIAGTQSGRVYVSQNYGMSWTLRHTFSFPILEVRYGFDDPNYILVVGSGSGNVYHSFNGGISWSKVHPQLSVVNREQSGAFTNYYSTPSGIVAILSGVLTSLSFSQNPGNIRTHTVLVDDDRGVMAVGEDGQHWVMSGTTMVPTQLNPNNAANYMIRDGEIVPVSYFAIPSGAGKSLNKNRTMEILHTTPQHGKIIAYGPFTEPPPPEGDILFISDRLPLEGYSVSSWASPINSTHMFLHTPSGWKLMVNHVTIEIDNIVTSIGAKEGSIAWRSGSSIHMMKLFDNMTEQYYPDWITSLPKAPHLVHPLYHSDGFIIGITRDILLEIHPSRVVYFANAFNNTTQSYNSGVQHVIPDTNNGIYYTRPGIQDDRINVSAYPWISPPSPSFAVVINVVTGSQTTIYTAPTTPDAHNFNVLLCSQDNFYPIIRFYYPSSKNGHVYKVAGTNTAIRVENLEPYELLWESIIPGNIYGNTPTEIHRITRFGEGDKVVIFRIADYLQQLQTETNSSDPWYILRITSTPSIKHRTDYLCAVVGRWHSGGWYTMWTVFHSRDGGRNWKKTSYFTPDVSTYSWPLAYYVPRISP